MQQVITKSNYVEVSIDEKAGLTIIRFLPATDDMTNQEWKEEMIEFERLFEEFKPYFIIDDSRDRLYSYSPDTQEWMVRMFATQWNRIGVKKYVQIVPKEISGKLSSMQIEELATNAFNLQFKIMMVDTLDGAMKWVYED